MNSSNFIYGAVGVWAGCGFSTIRVVFPPPNILGYGACVTPTVLGTGFVIIP